MHENILFKRNYQLLLQQKVPPNLSPLHGPRHLSPPTTQKQPRFKQKH